MAGAATLGHFLTWALFSAAISPRNYVQNPSDFLKVPILALIFGLGSLLVIGWLTIPLGIGIGLLFRSRRDKGSSTPDGPV